MFKLILHELEHNLWMSATFLWRAKSVYISPRHLTLPKTKGGIGLPDLHKYYWACHLTLIVDWNTHSHKKAWIPIAQSSTPTRIGLLPWIHPTKQSLVFKQHPLLWGTLEAFLAACKATSISSPTSPLTPLVTTRNSLQDARPHSSSILGQPQTPKQVTSFETDVYESEQRWWPKTPLCWYHNGLIFRCDIFSHNPHAKRTTLDNLPPWNLSVS